MDPDKRASKDRCIADDKPTSREFTLEKAELPNAENKKADRLQRDGEALQNGTPANLGS